MHARTGFELQMQPLRKKNAGTGKTGGGSSLAASYYIESSNVITFQANNPPGRSRGKKDRGGIRNVHCHCPMLIELAE